MYLFTYFSSHFSLLSKRCERISWWIDEIFMRHCDIMNLVFVLKRLNFTRATNRWHHSVRVAFLSFEYYVLFYHKRLKILCSIIYLSFSPFFSLFWLYHNIYYCIHYYIRYSHNFRHILEVLQSTAAHQSPWLEGIKRLTSRSLSRWRT